jgi:uncharacterized membrane protein
MVMGEEHSTFKPRPRIQTLSDLIFGLALSIGALTLIGAQPASFLAVSEALLFYGFSFLVLIGVWRSYSTILSVLPVETEFLTSLNIVLLFTVSIEPYLFNQLFTVTGDFWNNISVIYAVDLAVMFLILAFFSNSLAKEETGLVAKGFLRRFRFERNYDLVAASIFAVSALPIFQFTFPIGAATVPVRAFIWIGALLLGMARRLFPSMKQTNQTPETPR